MSTDTLPATQLPAPGDPRALYVIDISGYLFRAYHALPPLHSPQGEPTHAVLGVTTMLLKLVQDQKPAMLAVAMDSKGKSFRHELYPEYKATRPVAPPDLSQQVGRLREIIDAYAIPVLQHDGVEADDLIATVVARACAEGMHVVIVSADKDLLQLVSDCVVMYDTGRNLVFGAAETKTKLGVGPSQVRDYLALVGDSSDNVPGVPSVGPKTAQGLLESYGDLDGIYANLDKITKKALREKLELNRDQAYLSRKLVSLNDELPIDLDPAALAWAGSDQEKLHSLFLMLGFTRLLKDLPSTSRAVVAPEAAAELPPVPPARVITESTELDEIVAAIADSKRLWIIPIADDSH
ncbi:MAG TPA: 5'-3' exonuclease H3TH domain-containing protein, partial [Polyangiales bacterium]|nr:5'-3' exonuclease H3TH domain-containing protein [Polyangiales bacterium]